MGKSRQAQRQRRFKELQDIFHERELTKAESAELDELLRHGAAQYDKHHEGLWAMLRKRAKKLWKRQKADEQFDPNDDD